MTTCAAAGCENPVPRKPRGRPAIYCTATCRPSQRRSGIDIELLRDDDDAGSAGRIWTVRLRRGARSVTVSEALGWPSANALVSDLTELLAPRRRRESRID
jgi:hypothetical protein